MQDGGADSYSVVVAWWGGMEGWWGTGRGGPRRESNRTELGVNREGHTYNEKGAAVQKWRALVGYLQFVKQNSRT